MKGKKKWFQQWENVLRHASSHSVSKICKIPQRSVCQVLHTCGMNPHDIVSTDEAYFSLDGLVNRHNCVIWSFQNPYRYMQKSLHPLKVCVSVLDTN